MTEDEKHLAREILQRVYDCVQFDPDISPEGSTPHSEDGMWTDGGDFIVSLTREQVLSLEQIIAKI